MPVDSWSLYLAAFLVGLSGAVHCVGMCGGLVGALSLSLPAAPGSLLRARLPFLLAYNLGRLLTYATAGALAGGLGAWATQQIALHQAQVLLQGLAGLFMLLLGLYLGGWWPLLARLEQFGARLWRRIEPLGRRFIPVRTLPQALGMGLVWGWLPCGLVYSVLVWAVGAGGALSGAVLLLSLGLGTLPALLVMGTAAAALAGWLRRLWVRRIAGALVIGFGLYQLLLAARLLRLWGASG